MMMAYWRVGEVSVCCGREMWMMSGRVVMCWVMPMAVSSYGIKPSLRYIVMSFIAPVKTSSQMPGGWCCSSDEAYKGKKDLQG